ncbi:hypothetical protein V5799_019528 [Amblyomma americanum]|uniref:Monocarboxylate transporter n=1 Tax=Amblyomma americanum TaxID=6943 RepID=A0AAQ4EWI4_AMBAM
MPSLEERQQRPRRPVGPDGPLSWMVAVACSWNLLWSSLVRRSTGIIYVALVRTFGASREQTSWVLSVGTSLAWLIGPLVGAGTRHVPLMVLSFVGCFVTAVSAIGCAFARDMTVIFFLLGICSGIGNGIGMPTNDVAIGKYFRRYRGSGNGIYYAGGTLAGFAFPPIMNLLLQEYGFMGTFLITGGLMLNAIAACPFYRAPPWESKNKAEAASLKHSQQVSTVNGTYKAVMQTDTPSAGAQQGSGSNHLDKRSKPLVKGASILQSCEDFASYANGTSPDHHQVEDTAVTSTGGGSAVERAASDNVTATYEFPPPSSPTRSPGLSFRFLKRKHSGGVGDEPSYSRLDDTPNPHNAAANISGSINSAAVPPPLMGAERSSRPHAEIALYGSLDTIAVVVDGDEDLRRQRSLSLSMSGRSSSPWAYLSSPVFYMVCVTCAFSVYNLLVLMILVDLAMEKGFTRQDGAVFLSVTAIGDACARVVAGALSDRSFCDRRVLMGSSALLAGALCVTLPHMHADYYALAAVMCALFGWSNGTVVVLFGPVLADQLGVESLGLSSGTCRFAMGVAYLACPKITGYFKDEVGSYDGLLYMVSICCFCVGTMWTVDFVYRLLKRRKATTTS